MPKYIVIFIEKYLRDYKNSHIFGVKKDGRSETEDR